MTSLVSLLPSLPLQPLLRETKIRGSRDIDLKFTANKLQNSMSSSTTETVASSESSSFIMPNSAPERTPSGILKIKSQEASLGTCLVVPPYSRRVRSKRVRYSTLEIKSYPLCLGDNPAVRGSLPLALDYFQPCETLLLGLEDYERQRPPRADNHEELRLSQAARRRRLEPEQVKPQQLRRCLGTVRLVQQQRGWTHRTRALEPVQEGLEQIQKAVGNATWNRRRKEKERELLSPYKKNKDAAVGV